MSKVTTRFLGSGMYTLHEAAQYARVSPRLMKRWLFATKPDAVVIEPQFDSEEKLLTFLDLVQTLAVREIRTQQPQVPLDKIRQAIRVARQKLGISYPFARNHCTYLYPNGELVIRLPGRNSTAEDEFVEISGKHRGQRLFSFVESYLKNLSYSSDGLANALKVYTYRDVEITMNPHKRFGEPLLPSGYTPMIIYQSIMAEGGGEVGKRATAKAYGVSNKEVEASYHFVTDYILQIAA